MAGVEPGQYGAQQFDAPQFDAPQSGAQSPTLRASDQDRDRVIRVLRDGSVDGKLSHDTFIHRLDAALRARDQRELSGLVTDLRSRRADRVRSLAGQCLAAAERLRRAWSLPPHLPTLVLPQGETAVFTIGRSGDSDLVLADITVSRQHAELRRTEDGWELADLGSTNGTRANGWRVRSGFRVRAGDCVAFGRVMFRLADHA
ncbi:MAG TPA: DUF1707 and FHA domain-containing protein [Streptosporangiaceae bacterium]|nr:DUF1707 and FHA domain-containing protein [Streptosporangiaceae bacterium]